ncbi:MAG: glycosyltransferase family 25 protein [Pseudomonadota bacterium]
MQSVFGTTFERVVVINLDRRRDRMRRVRAQLDALGVAHRRFSAVDGRQPAVVAAWRRHAAPTAPDAPAGGAPGPAAGDVRGWRDFYLGDHPPAARLAFFERERGQRALATPGAWGLLMSMRAVIGRALAAGVESLLILEDDVQFHRDCIELWPKVAAELPDDWQVLQLGAMQLHWEESWIDWYSDHLYRCQGSSLAAHAVALRRPALEAAWRATATPDLPFDIGAMNTVKRAFRDQCFTCFPNLVIQDPSDTEIGMSRLFFSEMRKKVNLYRWILKDYGPEGLRPVGSTKRPSGDQAQGPAPSRPAPVEPAAPGGPRSPVLQPYLSTGRDAQRILVLLSADDRPATDNYVALLARQREGGEVAPIAVVDDFALFDPLRAASLAFEYVPTEEAYARALPATRDPALAVARRLRTLRQKWRPVRIMALGRHAQARLQAWRASPFEIATMADDLREEAADQASSPVPSP